MTSIATQRLNNITMAATSHSSTPEPGMSNSRSNGASAFASGNSTWNTGIWGKSIIGSGLKNGANDGARMPNGAFGNPSGSESISGSRSLLASSESDGAGNRNNRWKLPDQQTQQSLGSKTVPASRGSPERGSQLPAQFQTLGFRDGRTVNNSSASLFQNPPSTMPAPSTRPPPKDFLNPSAGHDFSNIDALGLTSYNAFSQPRNSAENSFLSSSAKNTRNGFGMADQFLDPSVNAGGKDASDATDTAANGNGLSRGGSFTSRDEAKPSWRNRKEAPAFPRSRFGADASNGAAMALPGADLVSEPLGSAKNTKFESLSTGLDKLSLSSYARPSNTNASSQPSPNTALTRSPSSCRTQASAGNGSETWTPDTNGLLSASGSNSPADSSFFAQQGQAHASYPNVAAGYPGRPESALSSDNTQAVGGQTLAHLRPYVAPNGQPMSSYVAQASTTAGAQANQGSGFDRRHKTLPHRQHQPQAQFNASPFVPQQQQQQQQEATQFRNQIPFPVDVSSHQSYRMNMLSSYYPVAPAPHVLTSQYAPRHMSHENDLAGHMRSPLLEDFRNSSKTNHRFDLKDIYGHIVEFSGDQHGSRFIQQKLETANSDEKEQLFCELHPNARQLMTDVFGNYVIQKFFEHGNQTQKKMLANQMKNHVLALSTQMYGCRVVQKALEHILTDQQAQLIKELESDVMRCVKDQNGNHVVQKAVERIPAEHIQFIINSFHGKVGENATHPYGCRVIQRMLEHCDAHTRSGILQELHACSASLINDQYGNYVTQHIIEHGHPEDRQRIINLIVHNIVNYSRHKFASNVVEKSIEFGSVDDRRRIIQTLTATNERGESPAQALIRDQYGNYVVQKLLTQLQGQEWLDFAEPVKMQVAMLKRVAHGKQIASVEKLLCAGGQVPPMLMGVGPVSGSPNGAMLPSPISSLFMVPPQQQQSQGFNHVHSRPQQQQQQQPPFQFQPPQQQFSGAASNGFRSQQPQHMQIPSGRHTPIGQPPLHAITPPLISTSTGPATSGTHSPSPPQSGTLSSTTQATSLDIDLSPEEQTAAGASAGARAAANGASTPAPAVQLQQPFQRKASPSTLGFLPSGIST